MSIAQFIYIIAAHFISHYLLQSDSIILQKGKHLSWAVLHSVEYMFSLFFIMLLGMVWFDELTFLVVLIFSVFNGVVHFAAGCIINPINEKSKEKKQYYLLSLGVGTEQLLCLIFLICSFYYLVK